jgi:predicted nucleic acid-binding protein
MPKLYYLDTCIWRDFFEDRISRSGNLFGKYAAALFIKIMENKDTIIFSDSLIWELKRDYDEEEVMDMLSFLFFSKVLIKIEITPEEYKEAKALSIQRQIPFIDCLHAIQARNHDAIMVSQDKHFIRNLSDIIKTIRPQEII